MPVLIGSFHRVNKIIILINIVLFCLLFCGCASESKDIKKYTTVKASNNILPEIDYISEFNSKSMLWWDNAEFNGKFCIKNSYRSKREIIIAVIDVGISDYFLDSEKLYNNQMEIAANSIDDDGNGYIDDINGWNVIDNNNNIINDNENSIHSSAILGLLIGEDEEQDYYGLLLGFNIKVVPIKSLNDNNMSGSIDNIINAVEYAKTIKADIVIMSFSTHRNSPELKRVIESSDMLFIVASGNEGRELSDDFKTYPVCFNCDNVISVAAMEANGDIDKQSNYGKAYVDVAAPGDNIVCYLGNNKFVYEGGTSFAVPFVAAEAAIIDCISEQELTPKAIKNIIVDSVDYVVDYEQKIKSVGLINVKNAIKGLN